MNLCPRSLPRLLALLVLLAGVGAGRAQDLTAPTVVIKVPGRSAKAPGGTTSVVVRGTAKDAAGVTRVAVEVPGRFTGDATLTAGADPRTVAWEATVPVLPGRNTVQATAFDATPNASRLRVKNFTFLTTCDVAVATVGDGSVNRRSATFRVGKTVRATATPRAGFLFEKWEIDGSTVATTRVFDFVVPDAAQAILTAVFVPNPYAGLAGNYNDVLRASASANGFFALRLNSNGSFSAKGVRRKILNPSPPARCTRAAFPDFPPDPFPDAFSTGGSAANCASGQRRRIAVASA